MFIFDYSYFSLAFSELLEFSLEEMVVKKWQRSSMTARPDTPRSCTTAGSSRIDSLGSC